MDKNKTAKFEKLYFLAKDTSGERFDDYEELIKNEFNGWLQPHIEDTLEKSQSVDEFLDALETMGLDESKLNEAVDPNKVIKDLEHFRKTFNNKGYKSEDNKAKAIDLYSTKIENEFNNLNNEILDFAIDGLFYGKNVKKEDLDKLQTYLNDTRGWKANSVLAALRKILDFAWIKTRMDWVEEAEKLKFNSHNSHNPDVDILEFHLDNNSFITYGIYVKDTENHKIGDEFMELYSGPNYKPEADRYRKSFSRLWDEKDLPKKYRKAWLRLRAFYRNRYKGK